MEEADTGEYVAILNVVIQDDYEVRVSERDGVRTPVVVKADATMDGYIFHGALLRTATHQVVIPEGPYLKVAFRMGYIRQRLTSLSGSSKRMPPYPLEQHQHNLALAYTMDVKDAAIIGEYAHEGVVSVPGLREVELAKRSLATKRFTE